MTLLLRYYNTNMVWCDNCCCDIVTIITIHPFFASFITIAAYSEPRESSLKPALGIADHLTSYISTVSPFD